MSLFRDIATRIDSQCRMLTVWHALLIGVAPCIVAAESIAAEVIAASEGAQ